MVSLRIRCRGGVIVVVCGGAGVGTGDGLCAGRTGDIISVSEGWGSMSGIR